MIAIDGQQKVGTKLIHNFKAMTFSAKLAIFHGKHGFMCVDFPLIYLKVFGVSSYVSMNTMLLLHVMLQHIW